MRAVAASSLWPFCLDVVLEVKILIRQGVGEFVGQGHQAGFARVARRCRNSFFF